MLCISKTAHIMAGYMTKSLTFYVYLWTFSCCKYRLSCVFVHNAFWRHVQKSDVQNFNSRLPFYKGGSVSGAKYIM